MNQEGTREIREELLKRRFHSEELLRILGVPRHPPLTTVLDVGSDPLLMESCLSNCAPLIAMIKISSAGWLLADENAIRQKVSSALRYNIPIAIGSESFIVSQSKGHIEAFLDLCADIGVSVIEIDYFTVRSSKKPADVAAAVMKRNLRFSINITLQDHGLSQKRVVETLLNRTKEWIDAGASNVLLSDVEKHSPLNALSPRTVLNYRYIDPFAKTFGLHSVIFDSRDGDMRIKLLDYFGPDVNLGGVRFDELLEVEAYRHGLHPRSLHNRKGRRLMTSVTTSRSVSASASHIVR